MKPFTPKSSAIPGLFLFAVAALGCGEDEPNEPSRVCPACETRAGGETSDLGGELTACGAVEGRIEVDASEAEQLGFDVGELRRRIERDVDAELRWVARDLEFGEGEGGLDGTASDGSFDGSADEGSDGVGVVEPQISGRPASGYEEQTRVSAGLSATGYAYYRPDPAFCDGGTCTVPGSDATIQVEEASCPDRLHVGFMVSLSTADEAVTANADGEAVRWREGFDEVIGDTTAKEVVGHATVDLSEVEGNMRLYPGTDGPYSGTLWIQLQFDEDTTHGFVWPVVEYSVFDERGHEELVLYEPVRGEW